MFEKFKYRIATKGYFNPERSISLDREHFLQILRGQVVNPKKLQGVNIGDYSFMVVGVSANKSLNSLAGKNFGSYGHNHAQTYTDWYGRFSCEGESYVVFPNQLLVSYFEPRLKHFRARRFISLENMNFSLLDSSSPVFTDRDLRVLVSDLSASDIWACLQKYKDLSPAK